MANKTINQFTTGSISDTSLLIIGDPSTGALSQTGYHAAKDYFTAGITGSGSTTNTGSLATTASLNALSSSFNIFSGSYVHDSASLLSLISSITGSGGGVSIVVFNNFTSSATTQSLNIFASESNYTLTSSFNTTIAGLNIVTSSFNNFSSSYVVDSSSFNIRIAAITSSGGSINTGSFVTTSSFNIYTASVQNISINLVDSSSIVWDYSLGNIANVTLGGNRSLKIINSFSQSFGILKVSQDSTGSRTLTLSGSLPSSFGLSNGTNQFDLLGFYYDGSTYYWSITNYGTIFPVLGTPILTLVSTGSLDISWSWTTVTSASNYVLQRANDSGYITGLTTVYSGTGSAFDDTGLAGSTTYYYRVKAQASGYNDSAFATNNATTAFGLDQDAVNFINAASVSSSQQVAINTFVTSLKSNNIWASMSAFYPMYGTSYNTVKWNLVNTGSFALTESTSGSLIYSSSGVSSVSGTALNTNFSASILSASANAFYVSIKTDKNEVGVDMGANVNESNYIISHNGSDLWFANNNPNVNNIVNSSAIGRYVNSRQTSSICTIYKNGSSIGTNTNTLNTGSPSTSSVNYFRILGGNNGTTTAVDFPSTKTVSSAGMFQGGLSAAQVATFDGLVATFESAIGH